MASGRCLCGSVRYEVNGPLNDVHICHCGQCRRQSGHCVAATGAKRADFRLIEAGSLKWYRSSDWAQRGFRRLGLTGTRWLVESAVYPDKLAARGLEVLRPSAEERAETDRIIMEELVYGVFKPDAVAAFQRVIGRMKRDGCDAAILGCTEIPLIMNDGNAPLPTLDSTRLLARAALRRAIEGTAVAAYTKGL